MKKADDEEIQKMLEQATAANMPETIAGDDFNTYKLLFDALKKEPEGGLPYNFAANTSRELQRRLNNAKDVKLYLWIAAIAVATFAGAGVYILSVYATAMRQMATGLTLYTWIFVFSIACLLIIQYLDQKLIKAPALGDRVHEK